MKPRRKTLPQKIILDTLKAFSTHPTVDEVYTEVRKIRPTISKNTVYRNLRRFAEDGIIRKVSLPGEEERYDRVTDRHYHFQCEICDSISDIEIDYLDGVNETVRQKYGIQINGHEIVFRGICPKCGVNRK